MTSAPFISSYLSLFPVECGCLYSTYACLLLCLAQGGWLGIEILDGISLLLLLCRSKSISLKLPFGNDIAGMTRKHGLWFMLLPLLCNAKAHTWSGYPFVICVIATHCLAAMVFGFSLAKLRPAYIEVVSGKERGRRSSR